MPLRRFKPTSGKCKLCGGEVELMVANPDQPPKDCPRCGQAIAPAPNLVGAPPRVAKKPSVSDAKSAGFHVFKRLGKDEYEKQ